MSKEQYLYLGHTKELKKAKSVKGACPEAEDKIDENYSQSTYSESLHHNNPGLWFCVDLLISPPLA